MKQNEKWGIMGGTFDPIHNAHLALAQCAYEQAGLDRVLFIPTGISYMKSERQVSSKTHRMAMVEAAIQQYSYFSFSDIEISRNGNSYTAETLSELHSLHPQTDWYLIIGEDSLADIPTWKDFGEIFKLSHILVANRPDDEPVDSRHKPLRDTVEEYREKYSAAISILDFPHRDLSATQIRTRLQSGEEEIPELPHAVLMYIKAHNLYADYKADYDRIYEKLKRELKPSRFIHTLGVIETAGHLAKIYGACENQARLAALLHDCAKNVPDELLYKDCDKAGIVLTAAQKQNPALLHAIYGAWKAEHVYGVKDEAILNAVRYHTTGRAGMSLLEQIIYVSDYIEPGRKNIPGLEFVRELAYTDITGAMAGIMEQTLTYLEANHKVVDELTRESYEYYKKGIKYE